MSNVLYNEYTDDFERDFDLGIMKESVKAERAILALSTIMEKEEIDLREAEIRCMEESADVDTLEGYYREAADESAEKKEGLIKRAWEFIKNMFKRIKEFLFGSKQAKKLAEMAKNGDEIGVDEEGNKFITALKNFKSKVGTTISSWIKAFLDQNTWKIVLEIVGIGVIGAAVPLTVNGVKKYKAGEISGIKDYFSNIADTVAKTPESVFKLAGDAKDEVVKKFHQVTGWISKVVKKLLSFVGIGPKEKDIDIKRKDEETGEVVKTVKDLDPKTKKEFYAQIKEIRNNKKKYGNSNDGVRAAITRLHEDYGISESSDDFEDGELFNESDMFDFELPDDMVEESVEGIEDISDLLLSL